MIWTVCIEIKTISFKIKNRSNLASLYQSSIIGTAQHWRTHTWDHMQCQTMLHRTWNDRQPYMYPPVIWFEWLVVKVRWSLIFPSLKFCFTSRMQIKLDLLRECYRHTLVRECCFVLFLRQCVIHYLNPSIDGNTRPLSWNDLTHHVWWYWRANTLLSLCRWPSQLPVS